MILTRTGPMTDKPTNNTRTKKLLFDWLRKTNKVSSILCKRRGQLSDAGLQS